MIAQLFCKKEKRNKYCEMSRNLVRYAVDQNLQRGRKVQISQNIGRNISESNRRDI